MRWILKPFAARLVLIGCGQNVDQFIERHQIAIIFCGTDYLLHPVITRNERRIDTTHVGLPLQIGTILAG